MNPDNLISKFNPEGSELREIQKRLLKLLLEVDKFCKAHSIPYWLSSGSVLGAIRHKGFIPWDDDIDIEMFYPDFIRFKNVVSHQKGLPFVFHDYDSDDEFVSQIFKIRDLDSEIKESTGFDKWYKYKGLYIDIFVRTPVNNNFLNNVAQLFQVQLLDKLSLINNNQIRRFFIKINSWIIHRVIFKIIYQINKLGKHPKWGGLPGAWVFDRHERQVFFPLSSAIFEGYNFPIPRDYDSYLRNLYGDYMRLPNLDTLHPHSSEVKLKKNESTLYRKQNK